MNYKYKGLHYGCPPEGECPHCPKLELPEYANVLANLLLPEHKHLAAPRPAPCLHLGQPTGETVTDCPTCPGKAKRFKVHACAIHGRCIQGQPQDGLAGCEGCADRSSPPTLRINHGAGGLGDALLGLCCAAGLKQAQPGTHITYKAHAQTLPFLRLFEGCCDDLAVHTHEYDLEKSAIPGDVQMNAGYQREFDEREKTRRWERYSQNIGSPGAIIPRLRERERLLALGKPYAGAVILAPFSTWANREWPRVSWLTLERDLKASGRRPIVIDSQHDRAGEFRCEKILGASAERVAGMMLNALCVIGGDSGPAHLGGILGCSTIALCGQTTGASVYGIYPRMHVLQGPLLCSGCWWRGMYRKDRCEPTCTALAAIAPERVMAEIAAVESNCA